MTEEAEKGGLPDSKDDSSLLPPPVVLSVTDVDLLLHGLFGN